MLCQEEKGRVSRGGAGRELSVICGAGRDSSGRCFRIDTRLRHLYISAQIEQLTGIAQKDLLGRTNAEAGVAAGLTEPIERACRRALKNGKRVSAAWSYNGRELRTRVVPERDDHGSIVSLLGITEDVTEFERATSACAEPQNLREADRRKDEFPQGCARDVRTRWRRSQRSRNPVVMSYDPERVARRAK